MGYKKNATVIVVHGAWADGSSWGTVINGLAEAGLEVICAPIPLTVLSDDAAAVRRVIGRIDGPVILVAHAYAGAVIAAADDDKVKDRGVWIRTLFQARVSIGYQSSYPLLKEDTVQHNLKRCRMSG